MVGPAAATIRSAITVGGLPSPAYAIRSIPPSAGVTASGRTVPGEARGHGDLPGLHTQAAARSHPGCWPSDPTPATGPPGSRGRRSPRWSCSPFAAGRHQVGRALDNPGLRTEGRVTLIDGLLATSVLVGSRPQCRARLVVGRPARRIPAGLLRPPQGQDPPPGGADLGHEPSHADMAATPPRSPPTAVMYVGR